MTTSEARYNVDLGAAHHRARVQDLQEAIGVHGLEGLLLLDPYNVMWASGFFHIPNERALGFYIPAKGEPIFFVPFLEKEHVLEHARVGVVRWYWEYPGETPAEVWMLQQVGENCIAVDAVGHTMFLRMQNVKPSLTVDDTIMKRRYLKTAREIELVELAASYADYGQAVARRAMTEGIRNGITEIEVVRIVQMETVAKMQRELEALTNFYRGAVGLTVHTGPRAALPHGQPGPVAIKPGDPVIVGIGATVGGFHAESGCTYIIGDPTADQKRCLEATWACDQAAVDALRPGAECVSVDKAALAVLREAGYGDFIRHRIGHGMGVQGHEAPWLSEGDHTILAPSMVFSNEPGIYRPGLDGYRVIDSMVVTPNGGRRLSRYLSEHGPDDRVIPV